MKRMFSFLLTAAGLIVFLLNTTQTFSQIAVAPSGSGTSDSPYLIATLNNLYWLTQNTSFWNKYFKQTADIDASSTSSWNAGAGFSPIGNSTIQFTGTYDGNGHIIDGLYINRNSTTRIGLFGSTWGAEIKNIGLVNVQIVGLFAVGGIVGYNYGSSTVSNSYSTGSVNGNNSVGGLVGYNYSGSSVSNSYSRASVNGGIFAGGLVGYSDNDTVNNSYSTGSVNGSGNIGGLQGGSNSSTVNNSLWDTQTSGQSTSAGGSGKTTAQMKSAGTFVDAGWSSSVWFMDSNVNTGYPYLAWQNSGGTSIYNAALQPSGSGTSGDPYVIGTVYNLYWITQNSSSWNKYFKQTADIDASSTSGWESGSGFLPIGDGITNFSGTYDGNWHTISGLFINRINSDYIGMFGSTTSAATIKNLGLLNVNVTGNLFVGGLVGVTFSSSTTINNCYTTGSINGDSSYVGGLVGYQSSGVVTNCYSSANVTGSSNYVGGLVGQIAAASLNNSYSTGSISGVRYVGGCAGYINTGASVTNCYSAGSVNGTRFIGGFFGFNTGTVTNCYSIGGVSGSQNVGGFGGVNSFTVTNSYWDTQTSGQSTSSGGTGKTTVLMKTTSTFSGAGWDFSTWEIDADIHNGYPGLRWQFAVHPSGSGTSGSSYLISSFANLLWITLNPSSWSSYFQQTTDINADSSSWYEGFTSIGNAATPFSGTYDGDEHTVSNIYISRVSTDVIGMFGEIDQATIQDLGLVNINITGNMFVGGLVGVASSCTINNCSTTGNVTGDSSYVGGLVGYLFSSASVSNCYSTSAVSGSSLYVGGLVGRNVQSSISTSYSTGSVNGSNNNIGGLAGYNNYTITNCYSSGSVSGSGVRIGGFVGFNDGGTITNCYSIGSVSGTSNVGGFIGYTSSSTVSNSFWNTQTSGQLTSAGGTGKTTTEMKTASTFFNAAWDAGIWYIDGSYNNGYPYLAWQNPGGNPLPVELVSLNIEYRTGNVELRWKTATEVNNAGWEIQRSEVSNQSSEPEKGRNGEWVNVGFVEGSGSSSAPKEYSFVERNVKAGKYSYRLKQIDRDGKFSYSQEVEVEVGSAPKVFALMQNFPNPFNPTTEIRYQIPEVSHVTLKVYDVIGREVATLLNEELAATGYHSIRFDASRLSTGVYIYTLRAGNFVASKKLLLAK